MTKSPKDARLRRQGPVRLLLATSSVVAVVTAAARPAAAVTVLSKSSNTAVYLGLPYDQLEFENPLHGTETVLGHKIVDWRDADFSPGPPPPPRYKDWSANDPLNIDGNATEIWMHRNGHFIRTATTAPSTIVSIHMVGDATDGLAGVLVDDTTVATLDMGTLNGPQTVLILVKGLASAVHDIQVADLGPGGLGGDVRTLGAAALQESDLKWDQPPTPAQPRNVFYGWNEPSTSPPTSEQIVADDWICSNADPVTAIHWWGSFKGWRKAELPSPAEMPALFHITIWTDVPKGPNEPFSHPGQVIWATDCYNFLTQFVGWDYDPRTNQYEACFRFDQYLDMRQWFWQDPGPGGVTNTYWISIVAVYLFEGGPQQPPNPYPWGWKARPRDPASPALDDAVRIWNPLYPNVGDQYQGGEPIWWPVPERSWDMAFELTATSAITVTKWDQPPQYLSGSGYFYGWDEPSVYRGAQIVADDWACLDPRPVADIHWWGSYNGWIGTEPPPDAPDRFHIGIWTDVPAGPIDPSFSHPGTMIWERWVARGELKETFAGWDVYPMPPPSDGCFRYDLTLPRDAWFYQEPGPLRTIYWLSISADYPLVAPRHPWGWKTRPRDPESWAPDDAVRIFDPTAPLLGALFLRGEPVMDDMGNSWDTAFQLTTVQSGELYIKWSQPPEPYTPPDAFNGWNELSVYAGRQIVADDWICKGNQPVTDIHWWGSFIGWGQNVLPANAMPAAFHIAIWTDVPPNGAGFSHPGVVLWETYCENFTWQFVGWDIDPRDPLHAVPEACFKFEQELTPDQWFYQWPGDNVYWISIAAVYPDGTPPEHPWGWKTRPRPPEPMSPDDAVRISHPTAPTVGSAYVFGQPIEYPEGVSWDMAFALTTTPPPEHDLGDAPDSTNSWGVPMTAYPPGGPPGVQANFPTVYVAGSPPYGPIHWQPRALAFLGNNLIEQGVSLENEADIGPDEDGVNNIDPRGDIPDSDGFDDGVVAPWAMRLPHCGRAQFDYVVTVVNPMPNTQLYVNVWFDWSRDGDWDDTLQCPGGALVPEWAVQNQVLGMPPAGVYTFTTPRFRCWHPSDAVVPELIWMRITLSDQPYNPIPAQGYGGAGPAWGYQYGETEDYYVRPVSEEFAVEFSLDIGSDTEISDPFMDMDRFFDPGDVYRWKGASIAPNGADGFKDDATIFGTDPWPDAPDPAGWTRIPCGSGGPQEYHRYFDLDGHDQLDVSIRELLQSSLPPIPRFASNCIHEPWHLLISYDDDQAAGWPQPPLGDVPVTTTSAAGKTYGTTAGFDEIIGVELGAPWAPAPVRFAYPVADEVTVHKSLAPNPDVSEKDDDDVDSVDVVPVLLPTADGLRQPGGACPFWYFTADHEATWVDAFGNPLDPGGIYEISPIGPGPGPVKVIDPVVHLGLRRGTDIRDFEFTWLGTPLGPQFFAVLFTVAPDDPLTPLIDESGGLNPRMIYASLLTGSSFPFLAQPLADNIDGLAIWRGMIENCNDPPQDADGDGDVDLVDFSVFQACFNGPNRPWPSSANQRACTCFDQDNDGDVDLIDFSVFQGCFNGPNRPPNC
jgi:hypothetical protein